MNVCSVAGCGRPVDARGFCSKHYMRVRRHGDPLYERPHANPWTARVACPSCGEDEWTLPYDPAEPLWHCTRPACGAWFDVGLAPAA